MATRYAACRCEQLRVIAEGEPVRISICHCLDCQRRTGSVFGVQARFSAEQVQIEGSYAEYDRASHAGEGRTFCFCPQCGATVFFRVAKDTELIGVPVGAFADPSFPAPTVSVWQKRRHSWFEVPAAIEQYEIDD
jgi:hypothetical protein